MVIFLMAVHPESRSVGKAIFIYFYAYFNFTSFVFILLKHVSSMPQLALLYNLICLMAAHCAFPKNASVYLAELGL